MAGILSHPFRLTPAGTVAVAEQTGDQSHAEQIAILALTRRGERPMAPTFGMRDPTFAGFDPGELAAGIANFGPRGVTVDQVHVTPSPDGHNTNVEVRFD